MSAVLTIREFTDPGCPWAFSAEPTRMRLRWLYGDGLRWERRMVVLSRTYADHGSFTPAQSARGMKTMQRRFGMPIVAREPSALPLTAPACRAVVAARLNAPESEAPLLRRLRVLGFGGHAIDEPATIRRAATEAGLDPDTLERWVTHDDVEAALGADEAAARDPAPVALALDHKLAGWDGGRRYTCPSYEITAEGGARLVLPGFQPSESYELAIANLAPELERRPSPESAEEVIEWAGEPLATAEVAALRGIEPLEAREELAAVAVEEPVGSDGYWSARG